MSSNNGFEHIKLCHFNDVTVIEVISCDVQGPERAQQFSAELMSVAGQPSTQPLLLDMRRCSYLSSMGYSALFKLVKQAKEQQRRIKFCNIHPDVNVGAKIVGLYLVVEVYDSRELALEAFHNENRAE
jgi:anti-anti-sigma factor